MSIDIGQCPDWVAEILHVWFEEIGPGGWFKRSDETDSMLRRRFERILLKMENTQAAELLTSGDNARAAILLTDQIPRNIYRGTPRAFAFDRLARELAKAAITNGWDENLPDGHRQFVAMPLMHSEEIADQDASLAYFEKHLPRNVPFAKSHHQMIVRFGRFPHRNAVLGRETTEEEQRAIDEGFSW